MNPDYYVVPKKLYPYDLKSAKQLTPTAGLGEGEGYRFTYYPYDRVRRRTAILRTRPDCCFRSKSSKSRMWSPDTSPHSANLEQVMAVFDPGRQELRRLLSARRPEIHTRRFTPTEMFLHVRNPRDLYKHWPPDVWQSIEQHQIKPGMNEFQAYFAIGMGVPDRPSDPAVKTVHYPNGGSNR